MLMGATPSITHTSANMALFAVLKCYKRLSASLRLYKYT